MVCGKLDKCIIIYRGEGWGLCSLVFLVSVVFCFYLPCTMGGFKMVLVKRYDKVLHQLGARSQIG